MSIEQRILERRQIARPYVAHLLFPDGNLIGVAILIDVSHAGFRADVSRELPVGLRLYLEPQFPNALRGRRFPFAVVWSKPPPEAELGATFVGEIPDAEVRALAMA